MSPSQRRGDRCAHVDLLLGLATRLLLCLARGRGGYGGGEDRSLALLVRLGPCCRCRRLGDGLCLGHRALADGASRRRRAQAGASGSRRCAGL
eukprot:453193-Pleurochrysis_carterae.AAC.1